MACMINKVQYQLSQVQNKEFIDDIKRIVRVCAHNGVIITLKEAEEAWEHYSETLAAGWLILPDSDEELWKIISTGGEVI